MNKAVELGQDASLYASQLEINPGTFEIEDLLSEPVVFNRPLDINPLVYYNQIDGTQPTNYLLQPRINAQNYLMQPRIDAQNYLMQPQIDPLNHIVPVEIDPENFPMEGLEGLGLPVVFNRPLDYSPMQFYNMPITGTQPRYYVRGIPFGVPQTFNIIPNGDEETSTGSTVEPDTTGDGDNSSTVTPPMITTEDAWTPFN